MLHKLLGTVLLTAALAASAQQSDEPAPAQAEPPVPAAAEPAAEPALAAESALIAQAAATETPATTPATEPAAPAEPPAADTAPGTEVLPLIAFEDAPLLDVIRTLARQAGINFLFDPRVTAQTVGADGKPVPQPGVTVRFENISAVQALDAILANHGLVMLKDDKTGTARVTIKDPAAPDPLMTKVIQLKHTDPEKLVALIKPTLSARSVSTFDKRTSQVVLIATEKEIESVEMLVETLDIGTRQVLIESHIVETSRNPNSVKGIDWAGTIAAQNVSYGNNTRLLSPNVSEAPLGAVPGTPSGNVVNPADPTLIGGGLGRLIIDTVNVGLNPSTAFINADGLSAVISFFNTDAESEIMATPRAVTLDNEKAVLSVTRAFPIFNITPGSANSPAGAEVKYTNLGTILEVTPRISANDTVALKVVPEVSAQDGVDEQVVGGLLNRANIYSMRKIEANVVVPSGNTLVMGGLVSDAVRRDLNKVPVLGDTPGLGGLFRKKGVSKSKANLIIFVTPTIVQDVDYQVARTDYLQNRIPAAPEDKESWFDSAKPHDWKKKGGGE